MGIHKFDAIKLEESELMENLSLGISTISPNGDILAVVEELNSISLFDTSDLSLVQSLAAHTGTITCLTFSPDGSLLASSGKDNQIIIWQLSDGQIISTLAGFPAGITGLAFSPDNQFIYTATRQKSVEADLGKTSGKNFVRYPGGIAKRRISDGREEIRLDPSYDIDMMVVSQDGLFFAVIGNDGNKYLKTYISENGNPTFED